MRFLKWLTALLLGIGLVISLSIFGLSMNTHATVFSRDTWADTIIEMYDLQRLSAVMHEIGPELAAAMSNEPISQMKVLETAIVHEMFAVAEVFQPALELYIRNAVHGGWDYLNARTEMIDLGEVSYKEVLDTTASELRRQVHEARASDGRTSETVALLSQIPENEFEQAIEAVRALYELGFVFLEPVAGSTTQAQVIQPTPTDEDFRREFQIMRSSTTFAVMLSAVVGILCIGGLALVGRRGGSSARLIGNAFLWYAIPSAVLLLAGRVFYSRAFVALAAQVAEERGGLAGEQTVNTARAMATAYGGVILRFFVPITIFASFCLAAGIALRVIGRRRRVS